MQNFTLPAKKQSIRVVDEKVKKEFKDLTPEEKKKRIRQLWLKVRIKLIVSARFLKTT